jgi:hypothetical protein
VDDQLADNQFTCKLYNVSLHFTIKLREIVDPL